MASYYELSQKNRIQSVPIAALCLYNIQRENLVLKNSLCIQSMQSGFSIPYFLSPRRQKKHSINESIYIIPLKIHGLPKDNP